MKTIIFLISTFISVHVFAQDEPVLTHRNSFELAVGMNQIKEANLHGKVHRGVLYGLTYTRTKQSENISEFEISAGFSRLKTHFESLSASINLQLNLSYDYLFGVNSGNRMTFFIGPEMRLAYQLNHYPNWDESHVYWADQLSLGVRGKLRYSLKENRSLMLEMSAPLISMASRPEFNRQYKIDDISLGGIAQHMHSKPFVSLSDKSWFLWLKLEYMIHISKRISQAICYSFEHRKLTSKGGFPFQNIQHNIGLKLYL